MRDALPPLEWVVSVRELFGEFWRRQFLAELAAQEMTPLERAWAPTVPGSL